MPLSEARKRANNKYNAKAYDMIPVRVKKGVRDQLKSILGDESVNSFLVKCIEERIKQGN